MQELKIFEHQGIRVLTTKQIAEAYEVDSKTISYNFNHNKARYTEGKHYILLIGNELRAFREIHDLPASTPKLYLWTEKGALLHAKSLNTDKAWEVYDYLVDFYFRANECIAEQKERQLPAKQSREELPYIVNPLRTLKVLFQVAEEAGIKVDSYPFEYNYSMLNNKNIGIRTDSTVERACYELAWELSHYFIHHDKGDIVRSSRVKEYNEQADKAAVLIINILNTKMAQL